HDELTGAHQPEARADFVPELDADLVKILRQLPIGIDFGGGGGGDDFLGRGAENPFTIATVLQFEQHVAGGFVTAALLPDFRRLERGHEHFERAGTVHFLTDDLLDLAQGAQTERQKGINAAGELADQPGAEQEFVRKNFRVSRSFAEGRNKCIGPLHVAERLTTKEPGNEVFYAEHTGISTEGNEGNKEGLMLHSLRLLLFRFFISHSTASLHCVHQRRESLNPHFEPVAGLNGADAAGCAGKNHVAGQQRQVRGNETDEFGGLEDELLRIRILAQLAVLEKLDGQFTRI